MLVVISPAKRLNEAARTDLPLTEPAFGEEAETLAEIAGGMSAGALGKLMGISDKLARLNADRFAAFRDARPEDGRAPAAFMFAGDTYLGLEAGTLDREELLWAQDHLRILSGLYGLLRPLDAIRPYRLEMGSRLRNPRGGSLYDFWGDRIARALGSAAGELGTDVLINCASVEYFGAVDTDALGLRVVTPVFMEMRGDTPKTVSFYAKKARGAMARFMIERRLTDPEGLKDFDTGGYRFDPERSEGDRWVFLRDEDG